MRNRSARTAAIVYDDSEWLPAQDAPWRAVINSRSSSGGAVAQLGARLDGIEEVVGSNPIGSTKLIFLFNPIAKTSRGTKGH
jgi:hypothetical protein